MSLPLTQLGLSASPDGNFSVTTEGAGSADGTVTVAGVGGSSAGSVGAATGTAEVSASTNIVLTTLGLSGVTQSDPLLVDASGVSATADGVATVAGVAAPLATGLGVSNGVATATADAAPLYTGVGASTATSTATAFTAATAETTGTADGVATAAAFTTSSAVATGAADGIATASAVSDYNYTAMGLDGVSQSSPLFLPPVAQTDTGVGLAAGVAVVDGHSDALLDGAGSSDGVATAEAISEQLETYTTLGLGGYGLSSPLYLASTSDEGVGSAYGTSTVVGISNVAIIEDIGYDAVTLAAVTVVGAASIFANILEVTASGGLSFAGTAPRLKGFSLQASGGLALAGTASSVKSRTWQPSMGITFSGFGNGSGNQQQFYEYFATGGIQFGGTGSAKFFKDYGPGATGKIRDKRRLTLSTRSYSRG